jgi:hypothetical protein
MAGRSFRKTQALRATHPVEWQAPVAEYLKLIANYRHLSDRRVNPIRHTVDEKIAYRQQLAQMGTTRRPALTKSR